MTMTLSGGCQCGRVRYTATVEPAEAYLCHCSMCRRATGGVSIAFVNPHKDAVVWEAEPDWYRSSPIARRGFCAACGTALAFDFIDGADRIDLTVGSFDEPGVFTPARNYATESMLASWVDVSHLPGMRSDENASVTDRWRAAGITPP